MNITKGFGQRVKSVRTSSKMTQTAFARVALSSGASAKNIGRIESEEVTPRFTTMEKIAAAGNVDLQWLCSGVCPLKPTHVLRTPGIGARIQQSRVARGMTRIELAKAAKLGASPKNVSRLELGEHSPRGNTLSRIAEALKVPVAYLAYGN